VNITRRAPLAEPYAFWEISTSVPLPRVRKVMNNIEDIIRTFQERLESPVTTTPSVETTPSVSDSAPAEHEYRTARRRHRPTTRSTSTAATPTSNGARIHLTVPYSNNEQMKQIVSQYTPARPFWNKESGHWVIKCAKDRVQQLRDALRDADIGVKFIDSHDA